MSLSILARSSAVRQQALSRGFHASKAARSAGHDDYHHLPFAWPGQKKAAFGAKVAVYLTFGFSIPFIASWYQIQKSAAATD
ncbi:hypothetical protein JR316_0005024 [Psilocybe cubensis]|uniref:Uncharacterized protein n=2 Tax=Psilocybe cubensis TaxID=181762 RepID=A0ACB8H5C3_PSICU|nr:hypothetical protein JR316_0005024 [Psilocybe cubensis]KAH9482924.1 hypothetical protein JR316_0005024 [Psilocybe cubensis]